MFLLFAILVVATIMFLRRGGQFGPAPWARQVPPPETAARTILAERFAHGDLSSEEFLERASALNWTPGVQPVPAPRKRRSLR